MKLKQLREKLRLGESQHVEFKTAAGNITAIGHAVCGFLNAGGGTIICGVDDKGRLLGVQAAVETAKRVEQSLVEGISPKVLVWVGIQEVEKVPLLVVEVPAGKDIPYAFQDTVYLRERDATRKAGAEVIRDMVLRRSSEPERWERRMSSCSSDSDTDLDEVKDAVTAARSARQFRFRDADNPQMVLEDFSLAKFGRLTQGGVVLFGQEPGRFFPQVRVRAASFAHDKASDTFRDMKTFDGPLVQVMNQLFDFIIRNTPTVSRFAKGKLWRQDDNIYPQEAIREGLVNAFAHRDYSDHSGGIAVHVYPSRLEIWNSGAFLPGITPDTLLRRGHLTILRNPDMAHVLYLRGFMEMVGRGSYLIVQSCKERGLPDPVWISDEKLGVTLTLRTPEVAPEATPEVAPEATPEVRLVLMLEGEMSRQEIQSALKLKDAEHFRKSYLLPALEAGLVEMTTPDKPRSSKQRYRLTPKGQRLKAASRT